ncbi:TniB family NTP-binding protein [Pseudomonas sp.]|uniref:TniB family NTP-binding protein n=1 Tax=Pseudomonas sp. TaxID=306 RepID=UPI002601A4EC|nr:TniB family NTP-binding protein [Pseudomonas sp.]
MAAAAEHVFPEIADLVTADVETRVRAIHEERWVTYPRAKEVLSKLERLFDYPPRSRMPCLLIVGRPGMGKTMLLERFCRQHSAVWDPDRNCERTPVLSMVMRPQPTIRRFYAQILSVLGVPVVSSASTIVMEDRIHRLIPKLGTKMLIADEIHNVFTASRGADRDALMALLRTMIGELQISLVCAGTNEAENAMLGDEQLASRYESLHLPAWTPTTEFQGLIGSAIRSMPLQLPSELNALAIRHMVEITQGVTARVFRVVADLAEEAILSGVEKIDSRAVLELPLAPRAAAA